MHLLGCTVMPYAWGSRTAIATLTKRTSPASGPEAELWMGAHPNAPSTFEDLEGTKVSLEEAVTRDPKGVLGDRALRDFGPRFPFLLKVLAAAEPLSLQAHPTAAQAQAGWDDEEKRAVPRNAPNRNYKDASHKPELLCALTKFQALSGFRMLDDTVELFAELNVPELEPAFRPLRQAPDPRGLEQMFRTLMTMPIDDRPKVVEAVVRACAREGLSDAFAKDRALALKLSEKYPGDIGIVSALLLKLVELEPGEAIYLDAGNLHAYLEGTGVEIMASSDNVLRGGLTTKHVDVPELIRVLDFAGLPANVLKPRALDDHEVVYDTPAKEFRLSRLKVHGSISRHVHGPEILLTTEGSVKSANTDAPLTIDQGCAAFVPAKTLTYALSGEGTVYRATTNLPLG